MPQRRAIPAEIRRRVLTAAGHCCVVCGTPCALEQAHIVPWHRVKQHRAENLLCLCANCHTRSHDEKWDAKTLRWYKQNPWVHHRGMLTLPATPPAAEPTSSQALRRYREWVVRQSAHVDLGDLCSAADAGRSGGRLKLARIYVELDTTTQAEPEPDRRGGARPSSPDPEGRQREPLSALAALRRHRRLALLGLPGSGKTTFLRNLSLHLAAKPLRANQGVLKELNLKLAPLPDWPAAEADLIPITVVLRQFAAEYAPKPLPAASPAAPAAPPPAPPKPGRAGHLWDFIQGTLRAENLAEAAAPLRQALEAGRAIVFFDGLDEVADDAQKQFVCQAVADFAQGLFAPCRMVLTCRTFSYRNQDWVVPGFTDLELAELSQERIERFIAAWFEALGEEGVLTAEQARHKRATLWPAIGERGLRELAGNPLQLTNMAVLHRVETLPDNRALLYDRLVSLLLLHWDRARFDKDALAVPLVTLREEADCREAEFVDGLAWLAWQVHDPKRGNQPGRPADIAELELRGALERLHPSQDDTPAGRARKADWALRVVAVLRRRGALLREEGRGVFRFPHRSYQEFLAGRHLAQQADFARTAAGYVDDSRHWWEVVRWAANYMAYVKRSLPNSLALAAELRAAAAEGETTPLAWRKVYLAGDILAEIGVSQVRRGCKLGESCLAETRRLLTRLIVQPEETLPAKERALAGVTLGKLEDDRPGVGLRADGLPDLAFDAVLPAGDFTLAENGETVRIAQPYKLGRYPVTVAQYGAFLAEGGYGVADGPKPPWWSEEGWRWRNGQLDTKGWQSWERDWYARQTFPILSPADYAPVLQTPNHPRVGVSWYEATAFCAWLTTRLHAKGELPQDSVIRLPTEAQWEQAARWSRTTRAVDDRRYPWGGQQEKDLAQRCNMSKTWLGHTSAVGMFPAGEAESGALDMSGNVWEWCESLYSPNEHYRALRGGSWGGGIPGSLRCSFRDFVTPDYRSQYYGFRCVWWLGVSAPR